MGLFHKNKGNKLVTSEIEQEANVPEQPLKSPEEIMAEKIEEKKKEIEKSQYLLEKAKKESLTGERHIALEKEIKELEEKSQISSKQCKKVWRVVKIVCFMLLAICVSVNVYWYFRCINTSKIEIATYEKELSEELAVYQEACDEEMELLEK